MLLGSMFFDGMMCCLLAHHPEFPPPQHFAFERLDLLFDDIDDVVVSVVLVVDDIDVFFVPTKDADNMKVRIFTFSFLHLLRSLLGVPPKFEFWSYYPHPLPLLILTVYLHKPETVHSHTLFFAAA